MKPTKLKILFACPPSQNPLISNLAVALKSQQGVDVHIGSKLFWHLENKYDVIHLHWIETLVNRKLNYSTALRICERLDQTKASGAKICATYHNIRPHSQRRKSDDFYLPVLEHLDGIIHMGHASQAKFEELYGNFKWCKRIQQKVISHPSYASTPNYLSNEECRKILAIGSDTKVVLAFGAIRSSEEADFCIKVLDQIDRKNLLFICPRWRIDVTGVGSSYRRKWVKKPKKIKTLLLSKFVSEEEVQIFLNSCDVVFLPRTNESNLNSGVVPLAFTFGKAVVGPNQGVIGEVLKSNRNFTFEPGSVEDAVEALNKALDSDISEIEKGNLRCSKTEMSLSTVGLQHIQFYGDLFKS